jgi:homogentisate 1,2-dioxygenase
MSHSPLPYFTLKSSPRSTSSRQGYAIHIYTATADMTNSCLANADGDFLIVPQLGALFITTEFGRLHVPPGEIAVIQRGMRFSVQLADGQARGYVLETFSAMHWVLPELGPIGGNGLANPRDFLAPTAWYEDRECDFTVVHKFEGELFSGKHAVSLRLNGCILS